MYTAITLLTIIACALLGVVVIIQNPKGGGLNPAYAKTQHAIGVGGSATVVEKLTWGLGLIILALSLTGVFFV